MYDNNLLAVRAYIFTTVGVVVCVVATFLSWIFYPPVTTCKRRSSVDEDEKETIEPKVVDTKRKAMALQHIYTAEGKHMGPWPAKGVSNPTFVEEDILY